MWTWDVGRASTVLAVYFQCLNGSGRQFTMVMLSSLTLIPSHCCCEQGRAWKVHQWCNPTLFEFVWNSVSYEIDEIIKADCSLNEWEALNPLSRWCMSMPKVLSHHTATYVVLKMLVIRCDQFHPSQWQFSAPGPGRVSNGAIGKATVLSVKFQQRNAGYVNFSLLTALPHCWSGLQWERVLSAVNWSSDGCTIVTCGTVAAENRWESSAGGTMVNVKLSGASWLSAYVTKLLLYVENTSMYLLDISVSGAIEMQQKQEMQEILCICGERNGVYTSGRRHCNRTEDERKWISEEREIGPWPSNNDLNH